MRIDPNLVVVPITKDSSDPKAKPAGSSGGSGATVVTLSAGASATAQATPVDVTARLQRIRALLAKGEYPVDLDRLASRIVEDDSARGHAQATRSDSGS